MVFGNRSIQNELWIQTYTTTRVVSDNLYRYKYGSGPIPFRKFDWRGRSKDLINIITMMLDMDPTKRPSCQELL